MIAWVVSIWRGSVPAEIDSVWLNEAQAIRRAVQQTKTHGNGNVQWGRGGKWIYDVPVMSDLAKRQLAEIKERVERRHRGAGRSPVPKGIL